jgi:hypothetical protein
MGAVVLMLGGNDLAEGVVAPGPIGRREIRSDAEGYAGGLDLGALADLMCVGRWR